MASLLILCNCTMLIINSKCIILNLAFSFSPFHPNTLLYLLFRTRVTPVISFSLLPTSSLSACQRSHVCLLVNLAAPACGTGHHLQPAVSRFNVVTSLPDFTSPHAACQPASLLPSLMQPPPVKLTAASLYFHMKALYSAALVSILPQSSP